MIFEPLLSGTSDGLGSDPSSFIGPVLDQPPTSTGLPSLSASAAPTGVNHVPGELLVQFKPGATAEQRANARQLLGASLAESIHTAAMQQQGLGVMERITLGAVSERGLQNAITGLNRNPQVAYASLNQLYTKAAESNDPYYTNGSLWGMQSDDQPAPIGPGGTTNLFGSQAEKAWADNITGSTSVVVGIIDEGIDYTHPDLIANIWTNPYELIDGLDNDGNGYTDDSHGWDFVNNDASVYDAGQDNHGTHVAGTIGGSGGNGTGVAGVNWNTTMISTKFLGASGGTTSDAVKALDYITDLKIRHGLNIVATNNSWGGGGYDRALHEAILRSAKADILFVAAAGNSSADNDLGNSYPSGYNTTVGTTSVAAASYDAVIAVAAINSSGALASFSSYGATTVDLGAPGEGIWSTVTNNSYASYSGTSMATPHVTGSVALCASAQSARVDAATLKQNILESATATASLNGKTATGGRLNVAAALQQAAFLSFDRDIYAPGGSLTISINHPQANLNPNSIDSVSVAVSSSTEITPESVRLIETASNSGRFSGSIPLTLGVPSTNGSLEVVDGDTVTASYAPLNQTRTARVDGQAPAISAISATATSTSAVIRWSTSEPATGEVRYGTSATALNQVQNAPGLLTNQTTTLTGLPSSSTVYYQVSSRDRAGNIGLSAIQSTSTTQAAPILFVDDDQGDTYETYYRLALDANGYSYDTWNVAANGGITPSSKDLSNYGTVIWNTGYNFSSTGAGLSSSEQDALAAYLTGGGHLFLSGQDILYNQVTPNFLQTYLKVAAYTNDLSFGNTTNTHTESGVPGNPISDGLSLITAKPANFPTIYTDALSPATGAQGLFLHGLGTTNPYSSVNYRGSDFAVVFMTTAFETISSSASDPNNQKTLLRRILDYLQGGGQATAPGITISAPSQTFTTETGSSSTFTVALKAAPTATVTLPLRSGTPSEGGLSTSALSFTTSNWNIPQTVTVTGVNEFVDDGDVIYPIVLEPITSSDSRYQGLNPADLNLTNQDNDTAGYTTSTPTGTSTSENGSSVSFTLRLTSQPLATVTVPVSSSNSSEASVTPNQLTFTSTNWSTPQSVTVTGVNDGVVDGNKLYNVVLGRPTSSTDTLYANLDPADLTGFTNIDIGAPASPSLTLTNASLAPLLVYNTAPAINLSSTTTGSLANGSLPTGSLTEGLVRLSSTSQTSGIEYRWTLSCSQAVRNFTFKGYRSSSADKDTFRFQVSKDNGSTWTTLNEVTATQSSTTQVAVGSLNLVGTWILRVLDTQRRSGQTSRDKLTIEQLQFTF